MKEILLFSTARSVDWTITKLGELGVVDIVELNSADNGTFERRKETVLQAEEALTILKGHIKKTRSKKEEGYTVKDPKQLIERVLQTRIIWEKGQEILEDLKKQKGWYETWGKNVQVKDLAFLKMRGIHLKLYLADRNEVSELGSKSTIVMLPEHKGKVPIVLISRNPFEKLTLKEESLPVLPLEVIEDTIERKRRQLRAIDQFLADQANQIERLEEYLLLLQDQLGMQQALESMGDIEGKLKYLKGYIPRQAISDFVTAAEAHHWGYQISEPQKPEEVPVYIKNPRWISIINPVMKFIDIVPGYREVDVSIYFLVAFALFFAMLVGDAGYGLVFLLVAFLFRKSLNSQIQILIFVLSGATITWGVLSGTYFGAEQIATIPFLRNLVLPEIASFGVDNISFMMHLSFLIGAIHLTIAHAIRAYMFINSIKVLSEVGWVALVWGLFLIAEQLVLGRTMPGWSIWLFVVGAGLVALFSVESKNFFRSLGVSLANLPLSLISGFSDIVSYVRLFAVGMATAAVASSFNNMILPDGAGEMGFLGLVMASLALVLGHGLNIALALMAVMVHGIRLNMLEFAGHLGVQFTGKAYKPFKLLARDQDINQSTTPF